MALRLSDVAAANVFADANVPLPGIADPMQRMSIKEVGRLFECAIVATGNPYLGITVGKLIQPSGLHAFGFGLLASENLDDFCQRVCNYYRIVSQNAMFKYFESEGESILLATEIVEEVCDATQDAFVVLMVNLMRQLYQREFNRARLVLARPAPEGGDKPYLDFFNCPVRFGRRELRIVMDSAQLYRPLPGASRELARYNDDIVVDYLAKLDKQDLVNSVRNQITTGLASGRVSIKYVAEHLHMSPRGLQMKLATQDSGFQDILDEVRHNLAMCYIEQSRYAITEISYLLGFADASNFTRAFKRWTGKSPSDFRSQLGT